MQGKIIKGIAGFYYVNVEGRGVFECKAKGAFRKSQIKPLVGDDVLMDIIDEDLELTNVVLEITEKSSESTTFDLERLEKKLIKLRENGLEIALDDFGSQRQNYDRIPRYNPSFLKLDKSIVTDNMLGNFVNLIHQHRVIVEGVETEEQLRRCIDYGYHYVQGFYFSIPLDSDTLKTDLINHDLQNIIQEKLAFKTLITD